MWHHLSSIPTGSLTAPDSVCLRRKSCSMAPTCAGLLGRMTWRFIGSSSIYEMLAVYQILENCGHVGLISCSFHWKSGVLSMNLVFHSPFWNVILEIFSTKPQVFLLSVWYIRTWEWLAPWIVSLVLRFIKWVPTDQLVCLWVPIWRDWVREKILVIQWA